MIHMPHRSVTRFFIPLIDVLLLLFGIFLLMPIASETELDEQRENVSEERESVEALQYELRRRTEELQRYESLRPELERVAQLKDEVERLRNARRRDLQSRLDVEVIDIHPKTGGLFYYDAGRAEPRVELPDEAAVHKLIERQRQEMKGRELYYYFLFPRPETGYPTLAQKRVYEKWFAAVPNSFKEPRP
jgi:hypothetical protein